MQVKSWGNFPDHPQRCLTPNHNSGLFRQMSTSEGFLPFGNGRSYGDSCLAQTDEVIASNGMSYFVSADWDKGIIRAQAGVTLSEILKVAIPNGWFLPVTPGTRFVTLGGAIANDVHGKNHHTAGSFGNHVLNFNICRSNGDIMTCSATENSDYFKATIGGLGLTGFITEAQIQLKAINSNKISQTSIKFESLQEFFQLNEELEDKYEYSVSWIDCLSGNQTRGHFIVGDHSTQGALTYEPQTKIAFPVEIPVSLVNKLTLKPFNSLYYSRQRAKQETCDVAINSFFYPLDGIANWNRMYGKKGFQQYQCVISHDDADRVMSELLRLIQNSGTGSFLAVLKSFGDIDSIGLLSFPKKGFTLALDFPQDDKALPKLFAKMDAIVKETGGRLYPAKDAHMSGEFFRQAYPKWEIVEKLRDPKINSKFWKRVCE